MDRELVEAVRPYVRGSFIGLAVGDALGASVETMTREEIMKATNGLGVTDYIAPLQKKNKDTQKLQPGMWTDDTQLALTVAKSLIRAHGFDIFDQALAHTEALAESRFGWGKTTTLAIEQLRDGIRKPTDPPPKGKGLGTGNGVAMKIAPMAIFYALGGNNEFVEDAIRLGRLTHHDPCASLSAAFLGSIIFGTTRSQLGDLNDMDWVDRFNRKIYQIERDIVEQAFFVDIDDLVSRRFEEASMAAEKSLDALRATVRRSFHAVDTVCFSVVLPGYVDSFEEAILEAVNSGGDADTNASMAGAINGMGCGLHGIPERWVSGLYQKDEIIAIADELLEVASS